MLYLMLYNLAPDDLLARATSQFPRFLRLEHSVVTTLLHHLGNIMFLQVEGDESILNHVVHTVKSLIS